MFRCALTEGSQIANQNVIITSVQQWSAEKESWLLQLVYREIKMAQEPVTARLL